MHDNPVQRYTPSFGNATFVHFAHPIGPNAAGNEETEYNPQQHRQYPQPIQQILNLPGLPRDRLFSQPPVTGTTHRPRRPYPGPQPAPLGPVVPHFSTVQNWAVNSSAQAIVDEYLRRACDPSQRHGEDGPFAANPSADAFAADVTQALDLMPQEGKLAVVQPALEQLKPFCETLNGIVTTQMQQRSDRPLEINAVMQALMKAAAAAALAGRAVAPPTLEAFANAVLQRIAADRLRAELDQSELFFNYGIFTKGIEGAARDSLAGRGPLASGHVVFDSLANLLRYSFPGTLAQASMPTYGNFLGTPARTRTVDFYNYGDWVKKLFFREGRRLREVDIDPVKGYRIARGRWQKMPQQLAQQVFDYNRQQLEKLVLQGGSSARRIS